MPSSKREPVYFWTDHALMRAKRRYRGVDVIGLIKQARIASDDESAKIKKMCFGVAKAKLSGTGQGAIYLVLKHPDVVYIIDPPRTVVTVFSFKDKRKT